MAFWRCSPSFSMLVYSRDKFFVLNVRHIFCGLRTMHNGSQLRWKKKSLSPSVIIIITIIIIIKSLFHQRGHIHGCNETCDVINYKKNRYNSEIYLSNQCKLIQHCSQYFVIGTLNIESLNILVSVCFLLDTIQYLI